MESEFYERRKEGLTGAELDSSSEKTTERSVLRLFSPLTAIMYAKDDWGELEECSEELFPSELCSYETEILEQIAKRQSWSMGILFVWEWRVEKLQSGR